MNISLSDRTFLNIVFNSSLDVSIRTSQIIRIYWINNKFVIYNCSNLVLSFGFTRSHSEHFEHSYNKVVSYIMKEINNEKYVDVKLFYTITTSKKNIESLFVNTNDMMVDYYYSDNTQIKRLILLNLLLLCA